MTDEIKPDKFNPEWKCKPGCVAHEVIKEWLEHGHARPAPVTPEAAREAAERLLMAGKEYDELLEKGEYPEAYVHERFCLNAYSIYLALLKHALGR